MMKLSKQNKLCKVCSNMPKMSWLLLLLIANGAMAQQSLCDKCSLEKFDSTSCIMDFDMDYKNIKLRVVPNVFCKIQKELNTSKGQKIIIKLYSYKGRFFVDSIISNGFTDDQILHIKAIIHTAKIDYYNESDRSKYSNTVFYNLIPVLR